MDCTSIKQFCHSINTCSPCCKGKCAITLFAVGVITAVAGILGLFNLPAGMGALASAAPGLIPVGALLIFVACCLRPTTSKAHTDPSKTSLSEIFESAPHTLGNLYRNHRRHPDTRINFGINLDEVLGPRSETQQYNKFPQAFLDQPLSWVQQLRPSMIADVRFTMLYKEFSKVLPFLYTRQLESYLNALTPPEIDEARRALVNQEKTSSNDATSQFDVRRKKIAEFDKQHVDPLKREALILGFSILDATAAATWYDYLQENFEKASYITEAYQQSHPSAQPQTSLSKE